MIVENLVPFNHRMVISDPEWNPFLCSRPMNKKAPHKVTSRFCASFAIFSQKFHYISQYCSFSVSPINVCMDITNWHKLFGLIACSVLFKISFFPPSKWYSIFLVGHNSKLSLNYSFPSFLQYVYIFYFCSLKLCN